MTATVKRIALTSVPASSPSASAPAPMSTLRIRIRTRSRRRFAAGAWAPGDRRRGPGGPMGMLPMLGPRSA